MMTIVPLTNRPWIQKNVPLLTFFSRASTWWMVIFMFLSNFAVHWKRALWWTQMPSLPDGTPGEWVPITLFDWLGAVLYVPALVSVIMFVWSLVLHLFFRNTIDKDTHDGTLLTDWASLNAYQRTAIHIAIRIGFFIGICILCAALAKGQQVPDQVARWNNARVNPQFSIALDVAASMYAQNASRYERITAMRKNGVPAPVIFCLHQRESSGNFRCHPHEGSPLTGRTRFVPKGRLPPPSDPPYTFEQSAEDAYYVVDKLDLVNWKDAQSALQGIESFNGLGYQKYHPSVPSPYLWSGTTIYTRGKYTGDGRFDPFARDKQLGCAAILLRLRERGVLISWE